MKKASDEMRPQLEEVLAHVKRFAIIIEELKTECLDLWNMMLTHVEQLRMARTALSGEGDPHLEAVYRAIDQHLDQCARRVKEREAKYEQKIKEHVRLSKADGEKLNREGICPKCGSTKFHHGPRGGMAENIMCIRCRTVYLFSPPFPPEIIHNHSGVGMREEVFDLSQEVRKQV
jgi:hypothetical protein